MLAWRRSFGVVSSFLPLEHIPDLGTTSHTIRGLLCEDGRLYVIAPNTFTNTANFLVADHANHFTCASLQILFAGHGFELFELDERSHRGAPIVTAARTTPNHAAPAVDSQRLMDTVGAVNRLARLWQQVANHLGDFEMRHQGTSAMVYGMGLHSICVVSNLQRPCTLRAFVDQNPYLQGLSLAGRPVIALTEIPEEAELMYLAVNPVIADEIKHTVEATSPNRSRYFQFGS